MPDISGTKVILNALKRHKGQSTNIIDAEPFPEIIRAAFSDIAPNHSGHALLYNLNMETVNAMDHWSRFQNVWLKTYSDNSSIDSVYILLPVLNEDTLEPCQWTSISGLIGMVGEYGTRIQNFPADLRRLRTLCRKTHFSVFPHQSAKKTTSGAYAFGLYLVLPRRENLLQMLEQCIHADKLIRNNAIENICARVRLILGAGIDSPYSETKAGTLKEYSYKFIIVIPQVRQIPQQNPCIIEEHVSLYANMWNARAPLKVPQALKEKLDPRLCFLQQSAYADPTSTHCVPLDFAFLWYHFFLNAKKRKTKRSLNRVDNKSLRCARQFLEDIRGGVPGSITDDTLREKVQPVVDQQRIIIGEKRRVGDFVMSSDHNWSKIIDFLNLIHDIISRQNGGQRFNEKQVGFRVWGKPSSGKTFLIKEWVKELAKGEVTLKEPLLGLEKMTRKQVESWVKEVQKASQSATILAFVDEVDKVALDSTVYQVLFRLTRVVEQSPPSRIVLLIAGSSGRNMQELEYHIKQRPAGDDLLERANMRAFSFPEHSVSDRLYIATSQILKTSNSELKRVELLAVLALAALPWYSVGDFNNNVDNAVRACKAQGSDVVTFEHMFSEAGSESDLFQNLYPKVYKLVKDVIVEIG